MTNVSKLEKIELMGKWFLLGVLCCLISKEINFCGLERCKSLDGREFDCSWQNLSPSFQLGRANVNFHVFPKHGGVQGQDAEQYSVTRYPRVTSLKSLNQMWGKMV